MDEPWTSFSELVLEWPPVPEHMHEHADRIVATAARVDGVVLDYSVESLEDVDRLLGQFHAAGDDPGRMAETMFRFGAYIGEVINRAVGSRWVMLDADHPLGASWPMVEHGTTFINPIGKCFKRVAYGDVESIPYFYDAMIQP